MDSITRIMNSFFWRLKAMKKGLCWLLEKTLAEITRLPNNSDVSHFYVLPGTKTTKRERRKKSCRCCRFVLILNLAWCNISQATLIHALNSMCLVAFVTLSQSVIFTLHNKSNTTSKIIQLKSNASRFSTLHSYFSRVIFLHSYYKTTHGIC